MNRAGEIPAQQSRERTRRSAPGTLNVEELVERTLRVKGVPLRRKAEKNRSSQDNGRRWSSRAKGIGNAAAV